MQLARAHIISSGSLPEKVFPRPRGNDFSPASPEVPAGEGLCPRSFDFSKKGYILKNATTVKVQKYVFCSKQDLEALQVAVLDEGGKRLAVRSQCQGRRAAE